MVLDKANLTVFVQNLGDRDKTNHFIYEGDALCHHSRRRNQSLAGIRDEQLMGPEEYTKKINERPIDFENDRPESICQMCWNAAVKQYEEGEDETDYGTITTPDHGAEPPLPAPQRGERPEHKEGVATNLRDRDDLSDVTGSRWRFKWAGDPTNVNCEIITTHDATFYELKNGIVSAIRMPTRTHPWGFFDHERYDRAGFEIEAPQVAGDAAFGNKPQYDAGTYTVGEALPEMGLTQYDRIHFICDFGTPTNAYGILKEPIITDLEDRLEEIDIERSTHGMVMWNSGEERPPRY